MSFDLKLENGNLSLDSAGELNKVENTEKLRQDVLKAIITKKGADRANPWYGSDVSQSLIGNILDFNFSRSAAIEQIRSTIENLQAIQKEQQKTQIITAAESIAAIQDIYINNGPDPRQIQTKISILSYAMTKIDIGFLIRL
jgi:predicted DNA-binding protein YlxM (UPF0122 family)